MRPVSSASQLPLVDLDYQRSAKNRADFAYAAYAGREAGTFISPDALAAPCFHAGLATLRHPADAALAVLSLAPDAAAHAARRRRSPSG